MQSNFSRTTGLPHHTAIVMDGNGRWALARGRPRVWGHRAGAAAVRRTVEAARAVGLPVLTLYAFSSDNWSRPRPEVAALMTLLSEFLDGEAARCGAEGIRLEIIGRRDRIPAGVLAAIQRAESLSAGGAAMRLRIAVDYSAREAIAQAARRLAETSTSPREDLARLIGGPDVDLLIRTGGEQRLSDFLLWEAAYAELVFLPVPWPEFGRAHLEEALRGYQQRQRRFGGVAAAV
jgi:undecaprenyl diphosphate synthase